MKFIFLFSLVVTICGLIPAYAEDGVESIFDGKTLDGWNCRPSSQSNNWSVEKGQIIGRGKGQESYLMFNDQLGDFELRFSYKLISDEGNTGVEVRSHPVKGKASRLHGYHADIGHIGIGDKVLGAWDFHENNRGDYLAKRGHKVTINENGKKEIGEIDNAFEPSDAKAEDWNKVVVYAKGNRLWFTINGKIASEVIDNEKAKRLDKGYIGFQLHGGDKMVVAFKDISVKR